MCLPADDVLAPPPAPVTPRSKKRRAFSLRSLLTLAGGLGAILLAAVAALRGHGAPRHARDLRFHPVGRERLERNILAHGDLEPAECSDVVCRVRGLRRNATYVTTIKSIIDDGTQVKRGQVLAELDDAEFREELEVRAGPLELARVAWVQAEENFKILNSQNESDLRLAEACLTLADLDLRKFLLGDAVQARKDLEGRLALALADRAMADDREAWADRMLRRDYIGRTQFLGEEARRHTADFAVAKLHEERRVFDDHTAKRTRVELEGKLTEAKAKVARVRAQARAKEAQADAARLTAERVYHRRAQRFREIQEQARNCVLRAPHDGLVVYAMSGQSRSGGGFQQSVIAQGEPVREGQILMRLPDLSRMVVTVRIHEALTSRVRGESWEATGFGESVEAALLTSPNVMTRLLGAAAFDEVRHHFHERELRKVADGLPALVRVAGHADRPLRGHVKQVSAVPSRAEAMSGDINVYKTVIAIDDPVDGLKPDLSADVTIFESGRPEEVLAIPFEAVVHHPGEGRECSCFVMTPDGPSEREIRVGVYNDQRVAVLGGLEEGEVVVLTPKLLAHEHEGADAEP